MASPSAESPPDLGAATSRHASPPPPSLRHRPLGRAATFAEPRTLNRRRSSIFSDTLSDARKSFKTSTEDLLLPRASTSEHYDAEESSHWHSLPLGLALLPAVGGMFFKNGSAVITDVTLLALAAVFMNWTIRVPWEMYRDAQAVVKERPMSPAPSTIIEEGDESLGDVDDTTHEATPAPVPTKDAAVAQHQLRVHEFAALMLCFLAPMGAAWLLHHIRSQLSRPSEGLVSNYNLLIFLLVAEVRPTSHLIKLIQRRTMFLQRRAAVGSAHDTLFSGNQAVDELSRRVEELEAHLADQIAVNEASPKESPDAIVAKVSAQMMPEVRRYVGPELDTLQRAMRRYEKRTTVSAVQFESRLQELEASLKDVVILAAAAQRNVEQRPKNYLYVLGNWASALIVIPVEALQALISLPTKILTKTIDTASRLLPIGPKQKRSRNGKAVRRSGKGSSQEREKRAQSSN